MKYLLVEDDCAPDANWWFKKQLKEKFGLNISDFKKHGKKEISEDMIAFHYNGYILESFAENTGWHLRKGEK